MASRRYVQLDDLNPYPSNSSNDYHKTSYADSSPLQDDAASDLPRRRPLPTVPDWRLSSMPLANMTVEKGMLLVLDVTLVLLPLLFLVLAVAISRLDGLPESTWGYTIEQASILGPTIWPILFAAVIGLTLQRIALYQAECGTTMGSLERLVGSQTMFTTVKTAYVLQYFDFIALLLLVIWSLSPLGGQASVRALELQTIVMTDTAEVSYQTSNTTLVMTQTGASSGDGFFTDLDLITSMYGAALFSSDSGLQYSNGSSDGFDTLFQHLGGANSVLKSSTQDIWGNVRIPVLQLLPDYNPNKTNQWVSVPHQEQIISYESLIGVPFRGIPLNGGNASFSINSTYFRFNCPSIKKVVMSDILNHRAFTGSLQIHNLTNANDSTARSLLFNADGFGAAGFSLDTTMLDNGSRIDNFNTPPPDNAPDFPPRDIRIISRGDDAIAFITCYATYHYVESNVLCASSASHGLPSCAVQSMRDVRLPNVAETLTPIDQIAPVGSNLLTGLPFSGIHVHPATSTPTEYFLADPPSALSHILIDAANLTVVPNDILADRFTLIFNTYWHATINTPLLVGRSLGLTNSQDPYDPWLNPWANTTASLSAYNLPTYSVNRGWLAIMIVATVVTFVTGIIGIVIKYRTQAPDIFGYVSSLTRDSPYLATPSMMHGSLLTGAQRARQLKAERVKFLHVDPERDMGRITLGLEPPAEENGGGKWRKCKGSSTGFRLGLGGSARGSVSDASAGVYHGT